MVKLIGQIQQGKVFLELLEVQGTLRTDVLQTSGGGFGKRLAGWLLAVKKTQRISRQAGTAIGAETLHISGKMVTQALLEAGAA
jgi:hypothetical protein